ncbi:MAG: hypothetical protein J2P54_11600 [Bradyrhizobiaceae bacterium]|nr:hypothetical protein [Bradyrhizobiaceae bacterium]
MTNSHLKLVTPNSEIRTVTPRWPKNRTVRTREHLTPGEVEQLIETARGNHNGVPRHGPCRLRGVSGGTIAKWLVDKAINDAME